MAQAPQRGGEKSKGRVAYSAYQAAILCARFK
jgi:hypothetical protein